MKNPIYDIAHFLLFLFGPEDAHNFLHYILKYQPYLIAPINLNKLLINTNVILTTKIQENMISHPIGFAAGFDKYGDIAHQLLRFGASFVEVGSWTLKAQEGNKKPRLFRIKSSLSLLNRFGFNNPGISAGLNFLQSNLCKKKQIVTPISIGKNKYTPFEDITQEYIQVFEIIKKETAILSNIPYIVINISSPNTPNLRSLQNHRILKKVIQEIKQYSPKPLYIKISPDLDNVQYHQLLNTLLEENIAGIILTNTSNSNNIKRNIQLSKNINSENIDGGLSGTVLTKISRKKLSIAYKLCHQTNTTQIIASGGISSKEEAWIRMLLGADIIQVYSGFIFEGPYFIKKSLQYMIQKMEEYKIKTISEIKRNRKEILKIELDKHPINRQIF